MVDGVLREGLEVNYKESWVEALVFGGECFANEFDERGCGGDEGGAWDVVPDTFWGVGLLDMD